MATGYTKRLDARGLDNWLAVMTLYHYLYYSGAARRPALQPLNLINALMKNIVEMISKDVRLGFNSDEQAIWRTDSTIPLNMDNGAICGKVISLQLGGM